MWEMESQIPHGDLGIFYRILSQNLSLSILVMIDDKAWGKKINPLPVLFLAGSTGNSIVNLEGPGQTVV